MSATAESLTVASITDFSLPEADVCQAGVARGWLWLGLLALIGSGILSIVLVLSRAPQFQNLLPAGDFFRVALVVHVDLSVLVWLLIQKSLIVGQKWAFWVLLFVIGFVEVMAFIASARVGNARWQVNVVQSVLYVVGIGLAGSSLFKRQARTSKEPGVLT